MLCDEKIASAKTLGLAIGTQFVFTAFYYAFLHIARFLEESTFVRCHFSVQELCSRDFLKEGQKLQIITDCP